MIGTQIAIWVDEFNFSNVTSQVDVTFATAEGEVTHLESTAQEFIPILSKCTVAQNGYVVGVDAGKAEELEDRFGVGTNVVTVLVNRADADCVAYVLPNAADYAMNFAAPAAGVMTLNGSWGTSAATRRGKRVCTGTLSATGEQASVDFGAGVTTGGYAFLHVSAITGAASGADIKVQSSPDDNTWSDEGTFTFSAVGVVTVALSGVVGRYIRVNCTDLGGATNFTVLAVVSLG